MWYVYVVCNGFPLSSRRLFISPHDFNRTFFHTTSWAYRLRVYVCVSQRGPKRLVYVFAVLSAFPLRRFRPCCRRILRSYVVDIVRSWSPDITFSSHDLSNMNFHELPLWIIIFKLNLIYRHQASPVAKSSLRCISLYGLWGMHEFKWVA